VSEGSRGLQRLRLGQWFGLSTGLLLVVALLGITLGLLALKRNADARHLLADRLDPAAVSSLRLNAALLNEETGVRGFLLTGRQAFLEPWLAGRVEEQRARRELAQFAAAGADVGVLRADVAAVARATDAWVEGYAKPAIAAVRRGGETTPDAASVDAGRERFDRVRAALARLQANILTARREARADLSAAARTVLIVFVGFGVLLLVTVAAAAATLRAVAIKPLHSLARQVRRVARGDFEHSVTVDGAREIVDLGGDVDSMRQRILEELGALREAEEQLRRQAQDLQRSNSELEQFAYVASHDLQEPLRKVASFCQLLEQRYAGQLDERADQYIHFAVDGAKRMQELINDLLAFSRVGRADRPMVEVDVNAVLRSALSNLGAAIEESGATVEAGELPVVLGEPALLVLVFQNLIGNAIKFRGEDAPHVRVDARAEADGWEFEVADNGIGIDQDYAERIFVIFQRLHSRASYEGTGIGLAMVRKIIEHHGGHVWLAPDGVATGTTFRFTLPRPPEVTPA
jgi:signal transduction histidine kinase